MHKSRKRTPALPLNAGAKTNSAGEGGKWANRGSPARKPELPLLTATGPEGFEPSSQAPQA